MRVVLVAFGSLGDVQPFVALGEGLRHAGHQVLLCGRPETPSWVDLRGLDFFAVSSPARPAARGPAPWFVRLHRFARDETGPQWNGLREAARGADLLLSTGSQLVVSSVAQALGVRHRSVLLCPQMLPSRRHPPMAVPWAAAPPWLHRAGRRFHIDIYNRAVRGPVAACRREAGLSPLEDEFAANFFAHPRAASWRPIRWAISIRKPPPVSCRRTSKGSSPRDRRPYTSGSARPRQLLPPPLPV
jgi:sterol 3beta-glucosyltransferase